MVSKLRFFAAFSGMKIGSARRAKENSPAIYRWVWTDEGVRVPEGRQKSCPPCAQAQRGFFRPYGTFWLPAPGPAMNRRAIFGRPCGTTARHPAAPVFPWWAAKAWLYSTEISEEPKLTGLFPFASPPEKFFHISVHQRSLAVSASEFRLKTASRTETFFHMESVETPAATSNIDPTGMKFIGTMTDSQGGIAHAAASATARRHAVTDPSRTVTDPLSSLTQLLRTRTTSVVALTDLRGARRERAAKASQRARRISQRG